MPTEAGKRLLNDLTDLDASRAAPVGDYLGPTGVLRAIDAIEAELLDTLAAKVAALPYSYRQYDFSEPAKLQHESVRRAAVLALIEEARRG